MNIVIQHRKVLGKNAIMLKNKHYKEIATRKAIVTVVSFS
jgi:hypothetical protein